MTLRTKLLALGLVLLAPLAAGYDAGASPLPDPGDLVNPPPLPSGADACDTIQGRPAVCAYVRADASGASTANVCVYDGFVGLVAWWYGGIGKLACLETHHWGWLGTPGACLGTGPTGYPTGCVGQDRERDNDGDGIPDETLHCVAWVAGQSVCLYD